MSEPTPLSAEAESFVRKYKADGNAAMLQATSLIDAQATEIAALRAVSSQQQQRAQLAEEKLEGYRQALDIDHIEIVISQELRRLYVGQLDALHVAEQHREAVEACFLCAVKKPPFDAAVRQAARVLAGWEARCPKCEGRGFIRTMVDGKRHSEPCSFCRMSGLAGKGAQGAHKRIVCSCGEVITQCRCP